MRILLNGDARELSEPLTVTALLAELQIDPRLVAVEVNRVVVKRARYADTVIDDGAEVEIVAFVGGGLSQEQGRRQKAGVRALRRAALVAAIVVGGVAVDVWGVQQTGTGAQAERPKQSAPLPARPGLPALTPTISEESMLIYEGWALIAAGDVTKASRHAAGVLAKYPRSMAALSLSVEADILRGGANAGLEGYERWVAERKGEEPFVLRRIARSVLWTSARNRDGAASDALKHLARDGDVEARVELTRRAYGGSLPDAKALAALDEGAVRYLIGALKTTKGSRLAVIDALVASKNRLAVPALIDLLGDLSRADEVAAAADGLGKLGANDAIVRLQPLAAEINIVPADVKWAAAAALYRLGDPSALPLLRRSLTSEYAALRLAAAEAMADRPDTEWQQVVRTLTQDQSPAIRIAAAKLIAPHDLLLARGILEPELSNQSKPLAAAAAQAMAQQWADLTVLRKVLRSADALARVIAAGRILELVG